MTDPSTVRGRPGEVIGEVSERRTSRPPRARARRPSVDFNTHQIVLDAAGGLQALPPGFTGGAARASRPGPAAPARRQRPGPRRGRRRQQRGPQGHRAELRARDQGLEQEARELDGLRLRRHDGDDDGLGAAWAAAWAARWAASLSVQPGDRRLMPNHYQKKQAHRQPQDPADVGDM